MSIAQSIPHGYSSPLPLLLFVRTDKNGLIVISHLYKSSKQCVMIT
jgi:hypothetical protein